MPCKGLGLGGQRGLNDIGWKGTKASFILEEKLRERHREWAGGDGVRLRLETRREAVATT